MRVMLLPNGIEHQCAARLANHPLAQELMDPKHFAGAILTVLYCQDLRPISWRSCCGDCSERKHFLKLYMDWKRTDVIDIRFVDFSLFRATDVDLLHSADILYMCGGRATQEIDSILRVESEVVKVLRERVQYDKLLYIGVCKGAQIAGVDGFNLFEHVAVHYDANIKATDVVPTDFVRSINMNTGCGILLQMHWSGTKAASVCVIKNARQWLPFVRANSKVLEDFFMTFACQWREYQFEGGRWSFRFDGIFRFYPHNAKPVTWPVEWIS
jgi:hypothetical protein